MDKLIFRLDDLRIGFGGSFQICGYCKHMADINNHCTNVRCVGYGKPV